MESFLSAASRGAVERLTDAGMRVVG